MSAATLARARRGLDELVRLANEPLFATLYQRPPDLGEASGHVSPAMLATCAPRSKYVRGWRRHAQRCERCAAIYRYFGLQV